jgi:hypothetical protein
MVNARLPKGIWLRQMRAGEDRRLAGTGLPKSQKQNAHLLSQMGGSSPSGLWGHDACG